MNFSNIVKTVKGTNENSVEEIVKDLEKEEVLMI